jgi:hypothetical protein
VPTVLAFTEEHSVAVAEKLDDVVAALRTASEEEPPLARFTRSHDEEPIFVNAGLVRAVWFWEKKAKGRKA